MRAVALTPAFCVLEQWENTCIYTVHCWHYDVDNDSQTKAFLNASIVYPRKPIFKALSLAVLCIDAYKNISIIIMYIYWVYIYVWLVSNDPINKLPCYDECSHLSLYCIFMLLFSHPSDRYQIAYCIYPSVRKFIYVCFIVSIWQEIYN